MTSVENNSQLFRWIGDGIVLNRRKSNQLHYKCFEHDNITIEVGDFVLVRNDDSMDPEDLTDCYVARVKDLYDTGLGSEPYKASVQWYSRIHDLPSNLLKTLKNIDVDYEVVEESRRHWVTEIDAETIFNKCKVIMLPENTDFEKCRSSYENGYPVFYCRYNFKGNKLHLQLQNTAKYSVNHLKAGILIDSPKEKAIFKRSTSPVIPLQSALPRISSSKSTRSSTTASESIDLHISNEESNDFTSSEDPKLKCLKVRLKRIDPKALDSQFGCFKLVNSEPSSPSVENITSNLKKKLSLRCKSTSNLSSPRSASKGSTTRTPRSTRQKKSIISDLGSETKSTKRSSSRKSMSSRNVTPEHSPSKMRKVVRRGLTFSEIESSLPVTRSGRKVKLVTPIVDDNSDDDFESVMPRSTSKPRKSPRKLCFYNSDASDTGSEFKDSSKSCSESDDSLEEYSLKKKSTPHSKRKSIIKTSSSVKKISVPLIIPERKTPLKTPQSVLEESRLRLHVSAVPTSLPCREDEYSDIYSFVKSCLCGHAGGCMYISGVPGTGKTATVHEVIRNLEEEKIDGDVPHFTFVEVNGMWLTDPYQCYVQIFKSLNGKTIQPQQAANLLEKRFSEPGPKKDAVVLLVDELDRLWTRKQTVMYNIFDWPTKKHSKLIVLAIANTMDLPERLMMNRISSRLGLTRKIFQPYTFRQLQEIVMCRIQELKVFDPDAVQLVARKVAAVSGDARRALDICRSAAEVASQKHSLQTQSRKSSAKSPKKGTHILVSMDHVDAALQQMFSSPVVLAIKALSKLEKLFLESVLAEFSRTGYEETSFSKVYHQIRDRYQFEGMPPPNSTTVSKVCSRLACSHLIIVDNYHNDLHMKIRLNVSSDDVNYALTGR